jgi:ABC-type multidrug transport system fused ATPase/permease subunit
MATFVFLSFLAVSSAAQLRALVGRFSDVLVCAARIDALLTKQPATIVPKEGRVLAAFEGRIELLDVHFAYRAREGGAGTAVLAGLTLSIQPGSTTAIVGHTGCGKSTIVALIHRLYDVQRGMVTADGVNVKELQPNWLREQIVVCHQVWHASHNTVHGVVFLDAACTVASLSALALASPIGETKQSLYSVASLCPSQPHSAVADFATRPWAYPVHCWPLTAALHSQDPVIFSASIGANITYGRGTTGHVPTMAQIEKAARRAHVRNANTQTYPEAYSVENATQLCGPVREGHSHRMHACYLKRSVQHKSPVL